MGKIHPKGSTWVSALHLPQGRCPEPAQYGQTFPFFDMQRPQGLPGGPRHSNHLRRDALPETIPLWAGPLHIVYVLRKRSITWERGMYQQPRNAAGDTVIPSALPLSSMTRPGPN